MRSTFQTILSEQWYMIPVSSSWLRFYLQILVAAIGLFLVIASLLYDFFQWDKGEKHANGD